jgi:hypothetical protein
VETLLLHETPLPDMGKLRGLYSPPDLHVSREFSSIDYYDEILGVLYSN